MADDSASDLAGTPDGRSITLASGARMPLIGFGTWRLTGRSAYRAVRTALDAGYRLIDTATMYDNEKQVGRALRDGGVPRDQLFVTTKLHPSDAGRERATIEASLAALGLDRVDLWLVHWPPGDGVGVPIWEEFLAARDAGLATSVGVSNYGIDEIDRLVAATGEAPAVDQVPWAPPIFDADLLAASRRRGVVLEGYSPFRRTDLTDPALVAVADRHGVSPAQVVLRWHVQHRVVAIPKSGTPARIEQNLDVFGFELSEAEMRTLDGLGT
ncbi:MAG TPA: aldo/keto reductase [Acidimicrobiales bacterium]